LPFPGDRKVFVAGITAVADITAVAAVADITALPSHPVRPGP
jgi:hypothetical protein